MEIRFRYWLFNSKRGDDPVRHRLMVACGGVQADIEALYTLYGPATVASLLLEAIENETFLPG